MPRIKLLFTIEACLFFKAIVSTEALRSNFWANSNLRGANRLNWARPPRWPVAHKRSERYGLPIKLKGFIQTGIYHISVFNVITLMINKWVVRRSLIILRAIRRLKCFTPKRPKLVAQALAQTKASSVFPPLWAGLGKECFSRCQGH